MNEQGITHPSEDTFSSAGFAELAEKPTRESLEPVEQNQQLVEAQRIISLLREKVPADEKRSVEQAQLLSAVLSDRSEDSVYERAKRMRSRMNLSVGDLRFLEGNLFENLARAHLDKENRPYPELEQFILEALRNPLLWVPYFEEDLKEFNYPSITKKMPVKIEPALNATGQAFSSMEMPVDKKAIEAIRELRKMVDGKSLTNNDAIAIDIQPNPATGKLVAVITGVAEVKNHPITHKEARGNQLTSAPRVLHDQIKKFRHIYRTVIEALGLAGEFPDEIDILPVDQLSKTIIQPDSVPQKTQKLRGYTFDSIPFSRTELTQLMEIINRNPVT